MNIEAFVDLVLFLSEKEKKIEIIRQILCEIPDFLPYPVYKLIDKTQNNSLDSQDISNFLSQNEESFSNKIIESTIIEHFSTNFENEITYKNFLKMVLPQENPYLRKEVSQREISKKTHEDSLYIEEIEYSLSKIMKEEILTYLDSDEYKLRIGENKSYELMRAIDKSNSGFIDFENLSLFFQTYQFAIEEEQIVKFLKRISKNEDLKIPKREFSNFLMPCLQKTQSNRTPLKSIDNKRLHITNYEKKIRDSMKNMKENVFLSNTLRLETADFQYSDNQDDQKSLDSIYESPIYKNDSMSKNMALIYIETQESLLQLQNDLLTNKEKNIEYFENTHKIKNKDFYENPHQFPSIPINQNKRLSNSINSHQLTTFPINPHQSTSIPFNPHQSPFYTFKEKRNSLKKYGNENFEDSKQFATIIDNSHISPSFPINPQQPASITINPHQSTSIPFNPHQSQLYTFKEKRSSLKKYGTIFIEKYEGIIEFLFHLMLIESKTEKIKQDLALRPDFNLLDFFVIFDNEEKGFLICEEVENMFKELGIETKKNEVFLFVKKFDKENYGKLKFSDFLEAFTPVQVEYADLLKQRRPINMDLEFSLFQMFSNETLKLICMLLKENVTDEVALESMRHCLNENDNADFNEFFELLDEDGDGFATAKNFKEIFQETHQHFNENDLIFLFNCFDIKKRGKFNLVEFLSVMNMKLK